MAYQSMGDKKRKIVDKECIPGGPRMKRKDMPIVDPLTAGKREKIVERTRSKTKQTEDVAYKVKMRKDKNQ